MSAYISGIIVFSLFFFTHWEDSQSAEQFLFLLLLHCHHPSTLSSLVPVATGRSSSSNQTSMMPFTRLIDAKTIDMARAKPASTMMMQQQQRAHTYTNSLFLTSCLLPTSFSPFSSVFLLTLVHNCS